MPEVTTILTSLVAVLAVARASTLIVLDDVLEPLRHRIFQWSPPVDNEQRGHYYQFMKLDAELHGLREDDDAYRYRPAGHIGTLLACQHCVAAWVAAGGYAAYQLIPDAVGTIAAVLALAQASEIVVRAARGSAHA